MWEGVDERGRGRRVLPKPRDLVDLLTISSAKTVCYYRFRVKMSGKELEGLNDEESRGFSRKALLLDLFYRTGVVLFYCE